MLSTCQICMCECPCVSMHFMHVHVYVCVWPHVCTFVCACNGIIQLMSKLRCSTVYVCAHMHARLCMCAHTCMLDCVCVRTHARMYVRVCMRVCARVCVRVSKRCMSAWQHHFRQWEGSQPSVALRAACAAFPPAALECRASAIYMINTHDAAA